MTKKKVHTAPQSKAAPKKQKRKLHELSIHEDIRYRGPLSYLHFQILGWLCIVLSVAAMLLGLGARMDQGLANDVSGLLQVLSYVTSLSLPFLLIANFARILNNSEGYKKQLLRNGLVMAAIYGVSILVFRRYIVGSIGQLTTDPEDVLPMLMGIFWQANSNGFIAFNLFVDLFLCSLFMFFMNARPKRVLKGKWVLILRFMAILPVAYELASMVLKWKAASGEIQLPYWAFPLLTVKPPMTFVVFMVLAIHTKVREYRFCRHGRTHEEYQSFLQTNRNSWHFSIYLAVLLIIASIVDLIVLMVLMADQAGSLETVSEKINEIQWLGMAIGFGEALPLMFVAPFVLLFSYTRVPKSKTAGLMIPIAGVGMIIFLFLEGIYQAFGYLPIQRVDLNELLAELKMVLMMVAESGM